MKEVPASSVILHTAAVTFWQRKIRDAFYENRNMHSICRILNLIHRYRRELKSQKEMVPVGVSKQIRSIPCLKIHRKKRKFLFLNVQVLHRNFLLIISAALSRELDIWITGAMRMTKFWLYCQISSALHGMQPVEMVMLSRSLRQL